MEKNVKRRRINVRGKAVLVLVIIDKPKTNSIQ
jgi:hypothetical protein